MSETALVVLFPELEPLIGASRRGYTAGGSRGIAPHVTLVYPFAGSEEVDGRLEAIARVLRAFAPFDVAFRETARFPKLLYLRPVPAEPFVAMTEALADAFPAFPPYGGEFDEIVPYVTVAESDEDVLAVVERDLVAQLPVETRCERVWLSRTRAAAGAVTPDMRSNGAHPCDSGQDSPRTLRDVREIDLAVYADALAGESAALSARAERIRSRLRQTKIERRARNDLPSRSSRRGSKTNSRLRTSPRRRLRRRLGGRAGFARASV
jgi:2'-5' RNA ligase